MNYVWSSFKDDVYGTTPRYLDQTHAFTASASWRPGRRWSLTGVWLFHSGWPTTTVTAAPVPFPGAELDYQVGPFYQERLDAYHRLDFRVSRRARLGKGYLTLFFDVQNLYNRDNPAGIAISEPDYYFNQNSGLYDVVFPDRYWLPILPSLGIGYEF